MSTNLLETSQSEEMAASLKKGLQLSDLVAVFAVGCVVIWVGWMGLTALGKIVPLAKLGVASFLGWLIFLFVGFPMWTIIHCIKSKHLPVNHKVIWVAASIISLGFGSVLYSFLSSRSRSLKWVAVLGLVTALGLAMVTLFQGGRITLKKITDTQNYLPRVSSFDLSRAQILELKDKLNVVSNEVVNHGKLKYAQTRKLCTLVEILQLMIVDRNLTGAENAEWNDLYESRAYLDEKYLFMRKKQFQHALKSGQSAPPGRFREMSSGETVFPGSLNYTEETVGKAEIVRVDAPGNLESSRDLGCVGITELDNKATPADLYKSLAMCIEEGSYQKAARISAIAGVYGRYDILRVADPSAHQAVEMLKLVNLGKIGQEKEDFFINAVKEMAQTSKNIKSVCEEIRRIGPPDYFPRYMVQHGTKLLYTTISGAAPDEPLVKDFNPKAAWEKSLDSYLHCPSVEEK